MPKPFVGFQEGSLLSIRIWTKHIINAGSECIFLFITVKLEKKSFSILYTHLISKKISPKFQNFEELMHLFI